MFSLLVQGATAATNQSEQPAKPQSVTILTPHGKGYLAFITLEKYNLRKDFSVVYWIGKTKKHLRTVFRQKCLVD